MQLLVPRTQFESGTFDPATDPRRGSAHAAGRRREPVGEAGHASRSPTGVVNAPLLAATAALVEAKLVLLQRAFYAEVARPVRRGPATRSSAPGRC